jgi:hypothetical protein
MLFESFSTFFNVTSWPTYLSMPCEVALKSVKKSFKNQIFPVLRQASKRVHKSICTVYLFKTRVKKNLVL